MTAANPSLLSTATRFRPLSNRVQSCSPSRSPIRKAEFTTHDLDPLLGNLSPESTLQAFSATETPSISGQKNYHGLYASIANASTAERALGIKAALAAQKVRQWLAEISGWHWPDPKASALGAGFLQPTGNEMGRRSRGLPEEVAYMGSLRADTVRQYEARIEEIKDGLEALDVEGLKKHVLDAHIPSRSRPGTRNGLSESTTGGFEYGRLDDLTAVITATTLQALPYLAELNMLIDIWDVRIAVLFEVPELVKRLNTTRTAVEEALKEVRAERSKSLYTNSRVDSTRERLETEISFMGVQFDRVLDLLEGHEDSLPNTWFAEMDTIESTFSDWVVEAEHLAMNNQWRHPQRQPPAVQKSGQPAQHLPDHSLNEIAEPTTPPMDSQAAADHAVQNELGEPQLSADHNILPNNPALVAFKNRPVRKASIKHSHIDSKGRSADAFPNSSHGVVQGEVAALGTTGEEQTTVTGLPKGGQDPDGHSSPMETSDVPFRSYRPEQQARLADLISLNHVKSAEEYQLEFGELGELDRNDAPPLTGNTDTQLEPSSLLAPEPETAQGLSKKKIPLRLDLPPTRHRREISQVSVADSALSEAFSDMSNVEIVDARTTEVLVSPKINVVDSPFRASRDDDSSFASKEKPRVQSMHLLSRDVPSTEPVTDVHKRSKSLTWTAVSSQARADELSHSFRKRLVDDLEMHDEDFSRPLMLHRASTASIEVIPKGLVRRVDSNRKSSYDLNPVSPIDSNSSPVDALKRFASTDSVQSVSSTGTERTPTPTPTPTLRDRNARDRVPGYNPRPVQPSSNAEAVARSQAGTIDTVVSNPPTVPRKSNKRQSRDVKSPTLSMDVELSSASDTDETPISLPSTFSPFDAKDHKPLSSPNKPLQSEERLEAKIKDILLNLPTRIRLMSDSDSSASPAHQSSGDSTRSSTPAPSLTLSPVRQQRSSRRYNASNSEVQVYHLIRNGQPRDTPPTKLHVRLVGENGERVMVRVGGGWADLAEYLREYSLHHGKRAIQEGRFEVANLPSAGAKASDPAGSSPIGPSLGLPKHRSTSRPSAGFDFGALPSLNIDKARRSVTAPVSAQRKGSRSPSPSFDDAPPVRPPPVPIIPPSFRREPPPKSTTSPYTTTNSPTITTEVRSRGSSFSTSTYVTPSTSFPAYRAQSRNPITTTSPTVTTTSALSTPVSVTSSLSYTPLGAAGPKGAINNAKTRAANFNSPPLSSPENEAWVQGMVGKARQVSAQHNSSHVTSVTGPNNITITSVSTPSSRRFSTTTEVTVASTPPSAKQPSLFDTASSPASPDSSQSPQTPGLNPSARDANGNGSAERPRSRNVMGIRRVFLRSSKKVDEAG